MKSYPVYLKFPELFSEEYSSYVYRLEEWSSEIDFHNFFPDITEEEFKKLQKLADLYEKNETLFEENKETITGNYLPEYQKEATMKLIQSLETVLQLITEEAESILELNYPDIDELIEELEEKQSEEYKKFVREENFFINH